MTEQTLTYYQHVLSTLNTSGGKAERAKAAPHKPILILTVMQAYETGLLTTNQIPITPELTSLFKATWNQLVQTEHTAGFALPFFHLKNEKGHWWTLVANPGCESWVRYGKLTSFGNLSMAVAYAQIDPVLASLLLHEPTRTVLRQKVLTTYFPDQPQPGPTNDTHLLTDLKREMLEETPGECRAKLTHLKRQLDPETYQINLFSRDTLFRREVVRLYDDTCCVTGIRVSAPYSFSMVDACHIVPFYRTFNNHPSNGIALCPNLHRAFDKGAISIDAACRVVVSGTFVEQDNSLYSLTKLAGTPIRLPRENRYQPDPAALAWHREHVLK